MSAATTEDYPAPDSEDRPHLHLDGSLRLPTLIELAKASATSRSV
jgi:hypothetical protein